jgi:hypothetical protein
MILCLGLYGSGSTWVFNAAREVAAVLGAPVASCYAENLAPIAALPQGGRIVKAHHLTPAAERFVAARVTRMICTIRDPRDAVLSLHERVYPKFGVALDKVAASAAFAARYADDPRCLTLRYEDGFVDDPAVFERLAEVFGGRLRAADRERLFMRFRRAAIEAQIAALPAAGADAFDAQTQWHRHHAGRTGVVGRWREGLTAAQVGIVEKRLAGFIGRLGY